MHSIARDGLEGATLRAVADEGGWSVGVVQHYFRNKSQLLAAAVDYLAEKTSATLRELSSAPSAYHQLSELLHDIIPEPGSVQAQYWRVWVCFWAQATNDPVLAKAVEEQARSWRERLAATIRAGQADGSMRADVSPEDEAAYLAAVIDGLGVTTAVDSDAPNMPHTVERLVVRLSSDDPRVSVAANSSTTR